MRWLIYSVLCYYLFARVKKWAVTPVPIVDCRKLGTEGKHAADVHPCAARMITALLCVPSVTLKCVAGEAAICAFVCRQAVGGVRDYHLYFVAKLLLL